MNEQITVPKVRLIGANGEQIGIVDTKYAQDTASEQGFDLVEVSPNSVPPVCKIMDYGKYMYELSKKDKLTKKKQHVIVIKEIRIRPKTDEHDLNFKIKHTRTFLEEGNKVKFSVMFRGREMTRIEFGQNLLERVKTELEDIAKVEREPILEGRNLWMLLVKK